MITMQHAKVMRVDMPSPLSFLLLLFNCSDLTLELDNALDSLPSQSVSFFLRLAGFVSMWADELYLLEGTM